MTIKTILVATDGSALSEKAIDMAVDLALKVGAKVVGVTSVLSPPVINGLEGEDQSTKTRLEVVKQRAELKGIEFELIAEHSDAVAHGIVECADRIEADFIVMASHGLGTLGSFLLGSETQKVLSQTVRPVLVVR